MTQYKSSADLKDLAKEKLKGKFGISMLVSPVLHGIVSFVFLFPALFLLFVMYAVVLTLGIMDDVPSTGSSLWIFIGVYILMIIVGGLLVGILNAGIAYFNLNLACGRHHRVSDLFCGFRYHFKKALALSAIQIGTAFGLMLPYIFCTMMWAITSVNLWIAGMILSMLLYLILLIYIQLGWSQSYYLLSDFPQLGAIELLKLSKRIMKGHKGRLFYIQLSFYPLDFLCSCTSGIGELWCTPYKNMTYTLFFLDLMQPAKQEPVIVETSDTELPEPVEEPVDAEPEITESEMDEIENASELF